MSIFSGTGSTSKKTCTHDRRERSRTLISKIDDYVKHIFRERNQEADYWSNLGGEVGHRNIIVDRCNTTETWKAVKGFRDGSAKDNGNSGCGVLIKVINKDRWVAIGRVAVPLKVGTAMATEVMGVCVLTEILDLISTRCLCIQNIGALTKFLTNNDVTFREFG